MRKLSIFDPYLVPKFFKDTQEHHLQYLIEEGYHLLVDCRAVCSCARAIWHHHRLVRRPPVRPTYSSEFEGRSARDFFLGLAWKIFAIATASSSSSRYDCPHPPALLHALLILLNLKGGALANFLFPTV